MEKRGRRKKVGKEGRRSEAKRRDQQTKAIWALALLKDSGNGWQRKEISKLEQSGPFLFQWIVATDSNADGPVPVDAQPNKQKTTRRNKD